MMSGSQAPLTRNRGCWEPSRRQSGDSKGLEGLLHVLSVQLFGRGVRGCSNSGTMAVDGRGVYPTAVSVGRFISDFDYPWISKS